MKDRAVVRLVAMAIAVFGIAGCASRPPADSFAGQWDFAATIGRRPVNGTLGFEVAGDAVRGTFTGPMGQTRDLENVRFDGTKLSFDLVVRQSTVHATGELARGTISGTLTSDFGSIPWSAVHHNMNGEQLPAMGRRGGRHRSVQPTAVVAGESSSHEQASPLQGASAPKPNIIFILTDDMAAMDVAVMPKLQSLVGSQGMTFTHYFVTDSLCCPSRSSILRGQFVHDHHTLGNLPPDGGFEKFHALGNENSTIATWLKSAGYHTALMGKYLNGYPATVATNYVPPGWDDWESPSRGGYAEFNYVLNENGRLVPYGGAPEDFLVDVMAKKAVAVIDASVRANQPFFLYLATFAPHQPATPAPRHAALFPDAKAPRDPSFDEADVKGKPQFIRALDTLKPRQIAAIDNLYRRRIQSLQSVDDLIETLVRELRQTGVLDHTYIVFTSDNGFHLGQHRMQQGKQTAYETDIHVPLIIRGPGIPAGVGRDELVAEIDLAPTFAQWAGLGPPSFVDGRSLVPLLADTKSAPWRSAVLIEHFSGSTEPFASSFEEGQRRGARRIPTYKALRTDHMTYVEYETGERELYDVSRDPYELENIYPRAEQSMIAALAAQLAAIRSCSGTTCRAADSVVH